MKEHTSNFETEIKTYGRQQAVQVIYEKDDKEVVLDNENVFSATPNFKASLLKSAMKSLILDCSVEIPVGTRLQFKYGILVGNDYEYLNFGYYIVNKVEKKEDARSYEMTCYDKMMLSMVDYIDLGIEYPITIRNYIAEICNHLEIDFGSNQDQFVNYDKEIEGELYLDENGDSLDYTFRDVLDELSQATASVICIDENDQLVVKYPQRNGDYETIEGTSLYIENADDNKIDLELQGNTSQNGTPTPDVPVPVNNVTGEQVVRVCGKNLFDTSIQAGTYGTDIVYTIGTDGLITQSKRDNSGWSTTQNRNFYLEAGTYTISCIGKGTEKRMQVRNLTDNVDLLQTQSETYTFTLNARKLLAFKTWGNSSYPASYYVQIEKGTTATPYEPYQGKDYEVNLGKNLINGEFRQGGPNNTNANRCYTTQNFKLKKDITYIFSTNLNTSTYKFGINANVKQYPTGTANFYDSGWKQQATFSFRVTQEGYLGINIARVDNADFTPSDIQGVCFQLEERKSSNFLFTIFHTN